jgi:hypothetical protein
MYQKSMWAIVSSGTVAICMLGFGTHALAGGGGGGEGTTACRDIRTDVTALRAAVAVLDEKASQANATLAIMQGELLQIRDALQSQGVGGLQVQVVVNRAACASGAIQCTSTGLPSISNQIPMAINLSVMNDQQSVTDLGTRAFLISGASTPVGGTSVAICAIGETDCGSPEFFLNQGSGFYEMWVHPSVGNWVAGNYVIRLQVTDTAGHRATKLVSISLEGGHEGLPGAPGSGGSPRAGDNPSSPNAD